jgi:hypothetical protein
MQIKGSTVLFIALIIGVAWYFGVFDAIFPGSELPTPPTGPGTPTTPTEKPSATLQWMMRNEITQAEVTTSDLEVTQANSNGVFNFLTLADNQAGDSSPEQGGTYFPEGSELILHLEDDGDPTNGEDYYDRWYYVPDLRSGAGVYRLTHTNLQVVSSSPTYTYKVVSRGAQTGTISFVDGSTADYWDLGSLTLIPRIDDVGLDQYLMWGGTTLASMTDGTTEIDTQDEQTADVTFLTDDNDLTLYLEVDTVSLAFGAEMYAITVNGEFQYRPTVAIFSTNCTAISVSALAEEQWYVVDDPTLTGDRAFYKVITPAEYPGLIPQAGKVAKASINIPVETTSATGSTAYDAAIWLNDFQYVPDVEVGSPSVSIPSSYGMIQGYGLAAMINDETYTVSSNAPATMTLLGDFTLPA